MNFVRGGRPGLASAAILEYWAVGLLRQGPSLVYCMGVWSRGYTAVNKKKKIAYNLNDEQLHTDCLAVARRAKYISAHTRAVCVCALPSAAPQPLNSSRCRRIQPAWHQNTRERERANLKKESWH